MIGPEVFLCITDNQNIFNTMIFLSIGFQQLGLPRQNKIERFILIFTRLALTLHPKKHIAYGNTTKSEF